MAYDEKLAARAALFGSVTSTLGTTGRYPLTVLPETAEEAWAAPSPG
jgi:hypothetical protein